MQTTQSILSDATCDWHQTNSVAYTLNSGTDEDKDEDDRLTPPPAQ